jgi:CheY-like chemotaxis protein
MDYVSPHFAERAKFHGVDRSEAMTLWSVLIVDDSPAIRKVVCELFARAGDFEVCGEAENGQQAVEKAKELNPALIVTDLSMPVMNGLVETRILRKMMPALPIILYSAHIDSFVEKEAFAAGASAVVPKSDAAALLITRSRQLLSERAA